jgi:hypothetical protein
MTLWHTIANFPKATTSLDISRAMVEGTTNLTGSVCMDLTSEATQQQIAFLEQHGHSPRGPLTRAEAADLIRKLRTTEPEPMPPNDHLAMYHLGMSFRISGAHSMEELRAEFWLDTCREATQMKTGSMQVHELNKAHGCRFAIPSREEVQEVLIALDTACPDWEVAHPELFFSTLELNFPELVRHSV